MPKHLLDVNEVVGLRKLYGGFPVAQSVEMDLCDSVVFESERDSFSLAPEVPYEVSRGALKRFWFVFWHLIARARRQKR